jgi:NitT/TauT family transport system substrate-binding protein
MADHGLELYGNAIIANTDFARKNPEKLTGFLRAVAKGLQDTVNDPEAGVAAMVSRNPAMNQDLEVRRLKLALRDNIMTDWVRENGVGGIDGERFARSLKQIAVTYEFKNEPSASRYFDGSYLPDDGSRKVK